MDKILLSFLACSAILFFSCKKESCDNGCSESDMTRLVKNWEGDTYTPPSPIDYCSEHYCAEMELNFLEDSTYTMHYTVTPPGETEPEREFSDSGTYKAICISSSVHKWAGITIEWEIEFTSDSLGLVTERIRYQAHEGGLIIDAEILDIDDFGWLLLR